MGDAISLTHVSCISTRAPPTPTKFHEHNNPNTTSRAWEVAETRPVQRLQLSRGGQAVVYGCFKRSHGEFTQCNDGHPSAGPLITLCRGSCLSRRHLVSLRWGQNTSSPGQAQRRRGKFSLCNVARPPQHCAWAPFVAPHPLSSGRFPSHPVHTPTPSAPRTSDRHKTHKKMNTSTHEHKPRAIQRTFKEGLTYSPASGAARALLAADAPNRSAIFVPA